MEVIIGPIFYLIDSVIGLYFYVVIFSIIMSWLIMFNVVNTTNRFVYLAADFLHKATEPALRPIRRFVPNLGGLDLSPIVLFLVLIFVRQILQGLAHKLAV